MMYTRPFSWCTSAAWEREQLWSRTKSQKLASLHAARHVRTRPPAWILCFIHLWLPAKDVPGLVINLLLAFGLICGDHTDGCCPAGLGRPAWRLERCHAAPRAAGTSRSCFSILACTLDGTHQLEAPPSLQCQHVPEVQATMLASRTHMPALLRLCQHSSIDVPMASSQQQHRRCMSMSTA